MSSNELYEAVIGIEVHVQLKTRSKILVLIRRILIRQIMKTLRKLV